MIADRLKNLNVSGIRKVFDLAAKIENPVNFSIGLPDFDVPEPVKHEAVSAIEKGFNRYTPTQGIPSLINKVKDTLNSRGVIFEELIITSGVSGGLLLSIMALLNPGDEVIIPDPYFVMYKSLPELFGAKIKFVDTYPDFLMTAARVEKLLTEKTKMIFLNNPSNPTGRIIPEEELIKIAALLKNRDIIVISDEIYDAFDYDKLLRPFSEFHKKTITLGGFSKSFAMTGWRVGYAAADREIIDAMIKLQQYTFVCAPTPFQHAALKALDTPTEQFCSIYKRKRDLVYNTLKNDFELVMPEGAFYFFIKHPELTGDQFVLKALEEEVLLIPGSVFSNKDTHFRLSFANTDEQLKKGLDKLLQIKS